ncbi:MAG: hypothetical protein IJK63_01330 [Oscillospiraceae bacterium]|nr:hypothetical protein [Oscillospiraceae bacterium]
MKKRPFENKIIIIGADHRNTLSAIRAFGQKNCDIVLVIHGHVLARKKVRVFNSKYVKQDQAYVIENEPVDLLNVLWKYADPELKCVVFPASDFAGFVIDSNYTSLEKSFIIPGFRGAPGKVCSMMDKWNQYLFACQHNIPMAETFILDTGEPVIPEDLPFPCIIKPRVSAWGAKSDISVCSNVDDLNDAIEKYRQNHYSDALVQAFLPKKAEANTLGFVLEENNQYHTVGGVALKIRDQLESATSFAVFIADLSSLDQEPDEKLNAVFSDKQITKNEYSLLLDNVRKINSILEEEQYCGHFDMDLLICNDKVYLNEINYRYSGNGYAINNRLINAPFYWANSLILGEESSVSVKAVDIGSYFMSELNDIMYLKRRDLSIAQWLHDIKLTKAFAVFDKRDYRGSLRFFNAFLHGYLKRILKH